MICESIFCSQQGNWKSKDELKKGRKEEEVPYRLIECVQQLFKVSCGWEKTFGRKGVGAGGQLGT